MQINDCKSSAGVATGLIDSIMAVSATLRDLYLCYDSVIGHASVQEAMKDLAQDHDLRWVLEKANELS